MWKFELLERAKSQLPLEQMGSRIKKSLHQKVLQGGETARQIMDVLHGVQLGHPLHPMLTDITLGAWIWGGVLNFLGQMNRSRALKRGAEILNLAGTLSAIPTAIAGLADFTTIKQDSVEEGALHGISNGAAFVFHVLALVTDRRHSKRRTFFSLLGSAAASIGGWLGGDLVYRKRVGVEHGDSDTDMIVWTPVMPADELGMDDAVRVMVEGVPVLVYRQKDEVYAVHAVCSHAGGPLEEGEIKDHSVQCPWHDSVFDLCNGQVVHGPATYPLPAYETRIHEGQIEMRTLTQEAHSPQAQLMR